MQIPNANTLDGDLSSMKQVNDWALDHDKKGFIVLLRSLTLKHHQILNQAGNQNCNVGRSNHINCYSFFCCVGGRLSYLSCLFLSKEYNCIK